MHEHPVHQLRGRIGAHAGDEAAPARRVELRPDHHRFERQRRGTSFDGQAEDRLLSHLHRLAVAETRTLRRDVAHRDRRRAELRGDRRLEQKTLVGSETPSCSFQHDGDGLTYSTIMSFDVTSVSRRPYDFITFDCYGTLID